MACAQDLSDQSRGAQFWDRDRGICQSVWDETLKGLKTASRPETTSWLKLFDATSDLLTSPTILQLLYHLCLWKVFPSVSSSTQNHWLL